jgi:chlorite dismutase
MEHLEAYLHDEEFLSVFQMSKHDFYALPLHKRRDILRKVDLF